MNLNLSTPTGPRPTCHGLPPSLLATGDYLPAFDPRVGVVLDLVTPLVTATREHTWALGHHLAGRITTDELHQHDVEHRAAIVALDAAVLDLAHQLGAAPHAETDAQGGEQR